MMNSPSKLSNVKGHGSNENGPSVLDDMDATLRLIATLPAPGGLEDRVFAGALAAPRRAPVLEWPRPLYVRDWVRSIAAAAIVLAVGGGGWGIYSHVEKNWPARAISVPRQIIEPGGFSSAEIIRRPQTLNGPVVKKMAPATKEKAQPAESAKSKEPVSKAAHAQYPSKAKSPQTASTVAK
jgi:hypothetical protein